MSGEAPGINVKVIGVVKSELEKETRGDAVQNLVSEIIFNQRFTDALEKIDDFSHMIVMYWIGMVSEPGPMIIHPHRDPKNPLTGILATNAPDRPNQVGLCVVKLTERKGNVLKVMGLSAGNGDAVIDIRPYMPEIYSYPEATKASWVEF